jgi:hypothetical protein
LLAICVIAGVWSFRTRKADFLTPPDEARLAQIRTKVSASLSQIEHPIEAQPLPLVEEPTPPPPAEPPPPAIDLGDLQRPPTLHEYAERATKGAAHLIELAGLLEAKGATSRALLAWERVLDSTQPDDRQTRQAIAAILRLRPTLPDWNTDHSATIAICLHASTSKKNVKTLTPLIDQVARDLEHASAGILKVTATTSTTFKRVNPSAPAPVNLWLTGPTKKSASTAVLPCTAESPKVLRDALLGTIDILVHDYLGQGAIHTPPPTTTDAKNPLDPLCARISRLCWQELGSRLNRPAAKNE